MERIVLEGRRYYGVFEGERREEEYSYRGDTGKRHRYWWEGTVQINVDGKRTRFMFKASDNGRPSSLEEAVIHFTSKRISFPRPDLSEAKKKSVVDDILKNMVREYSRRVRERDMSIPYIAAPSVDADKFEKQASL